MNNENPYQSPRETGEEPSRKLTSILSLERSLVLATFAGLLILNVFFDDPTAAAILSGTVLLSSVVAMTMVVLLRRK